MSKRIILLTFVILSITSLYSQNKESEEQQPTTLSLQEAFDIAFEHNPSIEAARYKILVGERKRQAARGMRFPQLSITGNYIHMGKDIAVDANNLKPPFSSVAKDLIAAGVQDGLIPGSAVAMLDGVLSTLTDADWNVNLQHKNFGFMAGELTMPIFMGGRINIANRVARIDEQIAEQQYLGKCNALMTEVVERYFGLALAEDVIRVRKMLVSAMHQHLSDVMAMEKNGVVARSERLFIEYKAAEAERELQEAYIQHQTISEALSFSLNHGQGECYLPASAMFFIDTLPDVEYFKTQALDNNPQLIEMDLQKQLAEEDVRLKKAEYFPQIVAVAGNSFYSYRVTPMLPRWVVGVGVELKLFDGLTREYNYAAARDQVHRVEHLQNMARNEVLMLIEMLYNKLRNCHNRILSLATSITFAEEYLRDKRIAFAEDLTTATDLTDAELNLAKAHIERIEALYAFDVALARLLEAAGISYAFGGYINSESVHTIQVNI